MDATSNIATDLFYKIRSRFTNLKLGENTGEITINPEDARFFDFDYTENDKIIGHVSISLAESSSLKIYFSTGITEGMDDGQKDGWYSFLREMRLFAKRRLMSFDTRDVAKDMLDQRDYAFLSQHSTPKPVSNDTITKPVGEGMMNESNMYGTKKQSYQNLLDTRLIIKHNKTLEDDSVPGARSRNIGALFVENEQGERFKYPFIHLSGAKAMQRHVANGGLPYDDIGKSLIKMSEDIAQLKNFSNYVVRNDLMNSDNNSVVERSTMQLENLKKQIKQLSKQAHYEAYVENFMVSDAVEVPDEVLEQYTEQFTVKNFKEDIKDVFPILYRLTQEQRSEDVVGYDDIVEMTDRQEEDIANEGESPEVTDFMTNIANSDDGYELMDQGLDGQHGPEIQKELQRMYDDVAVDHGYHGDDDFEKIHDRMIDNITDDYGTNEGNEELGMFSKFENWAMNLGEESPLTLADEGEKEDLINKLNKLVGDHFPAGIDGKNAINSLQGIIEDPRLETEIKKQAEKDPDGCVRGLVKSWIEENDPDTLPKLDFGDFVDEPAVEEGMDPAKEQEVMKLFKDFDEQANEIGAYGDPDVKKAMALVQAGKIEDASEEIANAYADQDGGEVNDIEGMYTDLVQDLLYVTGASGTTEGNIESQNKQMNVKEVAEFIFSFYDKASETFPKGPEGVCTMVGKKFGEQAEQVARKLVERMAPEQEAGAEAVEASAQEEHDELDRIKSLSGM